MDIHERIEELKTKKDRVIKIYEHISEKMDNINSYYSTELQNLEGKYKLEKETLEKKYESMKSDMLISCEEITREKEELCDDLYNVTNDEDVIYLRFGDVVEEILNIAGDKFGHLDVAAQLEPCQFENKLSLDELKKHYENNKMVDLYLSVSNDYRVEIEFDGIKKDVFEKMNNGKSIFDCMNVSYHNVEYDYGYFVDSPKENLETSIELDVEDFYDVEVPIPLQSIVASKNSAFKYEDVSIFNTPLDVYSKAIMNCINKNKVKVKK